MGISRFWLTMADKEIKVRRRITRMIQMAKNDRSVRRALPVYDNADVEVTHIADQQKSEGHK